MTELQRLSELATKLHQEEALSLPSIPWPARNSLHFPERAYYLCSPSCGKGCTDIAAKRRYQAQCKVHLRQA